VALLNGGRIDSNTLGAYYLRNFFLNILIDTSCKNWNHDFVRQVFSVDIASAIFSTLLREQVTNDKLIWKAEKNGLYSIKSAYRLSVKEFVDTCHI